MMEVIYSKFNIERSAAFQIATTIINNNGKKVIKEPIHEKSKQHICKMIQYYETYTNENLTPCKREHDSAVFDYIEGSSICDILFHFVEQDDHEGFISQIYEYKAFLLSFINDDDIQQFIISDDFKIVFGELKSEVYLEAGLHINIDLMFDNIILDQHNVKKVIDYEWVFDFSIPINFVVWRAIYSFFSKYGKQLLGFMNLSEVLSIFNIDETQACVFKTMDENFLKYVYGFTHNYESIIKKYSIPSIHVKNEFIEHKLTLHSEVFIDYGEGFNIENCIIQHKAYNVEEKLHLHFTISSNKLIKRLRFDPISGAGIIKIYDILCNYEQKVKSMFDFNFESNETLVFQSYYVFHNEDPQFIFNVDMGKITSIDVIMKIIPESELSSNLSKEMYKICGTTKFNEIALEINRLKEELQRRLRYEDRLIENKRDLEKELSKMAEEVRDLNR